MKLLEKIIKASKILGIVLTNRSNGSSKIELKELSTSFYRHFLPKLVLLEKELQYDQLEDPKTTKKIVKRGVTELVIWSFIAETLSQTRKVIIFDINIF